MKNLNLKNSLIVLLILSVLVYFILLEIKNIEPTILEVIKLTPQVVSFDLLVVSIFSSYLWKWRIFKGWLVPFPNLGGTWKGYIHSTWIDPITQSRPAPIPAILTIKQSFLKISCVMRTGEMISRSCIADFILDKDNQLCKLCYTYDSNPLQTVKDRSAQHCGTMLFDISGKNQKRIEGEYWTGRKTTGNVAMDFWKKELLDAYPKSLGEHPVSVIRGNQS